ncbi:winged helix DNA-binding domain-containing protein [Kocuria indica]|uniref:Winged helix DNA-binding domain-containing protein n=1 Tax=Kocuria marina subsp. indica TaxID=1049583 RepID=A0A6N9R153_9MICC|nr:winged helix DNA-binding domain-containing protein [Kocuria indica]NDO78944.1 winged helix DNA-binding domain-containing protein [Kocuria indica]
MSAAHRSEAVSAAQLRRWTLARQHLIEPATMSVVDLTEHLVGLQAQTPWSWYAGFHARQHPADAEEISSYLGEKHLVRMSSLRATIHLMTPRDAVSLRAMTQPVHDRTLASSFGRELAGVGLDAVTAAAGELLAERPMTLKDLGGQLSRTWPDTSPSALAMVARYRLPLVQLPPRGLWRQSGPIAYATLEQWLGNSPEPGLSITDYILRYLAAYGPATVMDFQAWAGITKTRPHFDKLADDLITFRDERGQRLYDLPQAPRPTDARALPVRLLYDYDNLLLAYKDRSRFITEPYAARQREMDGVTAQAVLVNGITAGTWRHSTDEGTSRIDIVLIESVNRRVLDLLRTQAWNLARWLDPSCDVLISISDSR